jgi:hypothetical protein
VGTEARSTRLLAACAVAVATLCAAAPAGRAATPDGYQHGFVLTGWKSDSYLAPRSDALLRTFAGDGSDHAAICTQWFMDGPTSSQVAPDPGRTPTDAAMRRAIAVAQDAGMAVTLKPQIGIRTGNWIGSAHPADLAAFWADYRTMLLHYADLAEQTGAQMLVVGTEMNTLSWDEAHWRPLIADVRTRFHGKLTYAANYDEYQRVPFWDALDYIGVDAYYGLADEANPAPPVADMVAAWQSRGYLPRLRAVSQRTGKQVLFTEIGYRGTHATAVHPNWWNVVDDADTQAQANAYEAFYQAIAGQTWVAGFYWWDANTDSWSVQDYSPIGKPAERVMSEWNGAGHEPAPPPPPSTPPADPAASSPTSVAVAVRGRRVRGAVSPYSRACRGRVQIRLQRRMHGHWREARPLPPFSPTATGAFARTLPRGHLRVRVGFRSRCGSLSSRWAATRR